jgi:hypothetical protein
MTLEILSKWRAQGEMGIAAADYRPTAVFAVSDPIVALAQNRVAADEPMVSTRTARLSSILLRPHSLA